MDRRRYGETRSWDLYDSMRRAALDISSLLAEKIDIRERVCARVGLKRSRQAADHLECRYRRITTAHSSLPTTYKYASRIYGLCEIHDGS